LTQTILFAVKLRKSWWTFVWAQTLFTFSYLVPTPLPLSFRHDSRIYIYYSTAEKHRRWRRRRRQCNRM